ncbi:MAG: M20 family metallo-hydrolase [Treponema sp.]|nr:M20 family metallo-hydrolase [Treponema sp.]
MLDFEKLKQNIRTHERDMVALEGLLTSHPALSPENGGDGELEKCAALEKWLTAHGFADLQRFDAPDARVSSKIRPNLIATVKGKSDERTIWVMAHLDVVPTGNLALWQTDPWQVVEKDGKLFGRGVEDNQQGLVSGVFAALSCLETGIVPAYTVKLLFIADEECGSTYGIRYLLEKHGNLFRKEDFILIPDGGDSKGETIEIAEKNILWLRVHTSGKQCHGSRPDEGKNACLAACDLALRLHDLENCFAAKDALFAPDRSTFQPTKREPNVDGVNIIPGDDVFYMDCRILPRYTLDEVRAEVKKRVVAVEKQYGVKVVVDEEQSSQSPATSADAPVVKELATAIKEAHGITAKTIGIGGGTVGAYLRCRGYDAVVWSTMDELAHQPNEYCIIENIIKDAETLAALFVRG